jgi:hypothetical protein
MYQATTATASTTTASSVTTTTINSPTIQTLGQQAAASTNKGSSLAAAGMAVTAVGVAVNCFSVPMNVPMCKLFAAGLAVTTAVKLFMGNASNQSNGTVAAVTTTSDPYNLNGGDAGGTSKPGQPAPPQAPNYANDPDVKNALATLSKLESQGWKVDLQKGTVTTPDGTTISGSTLNSASAMQAAGISKNAFDAFQKEMAKVPGLAAEKAKSADAGSDLFGDSPGGGGSKSSSAGGNAYAGLAMGPGPKLGISRDPAQVAGLAKTLPNGEKMGVAEDDIYEMIHRRVHVEGEKLPFIP